MNDDKSLTIKARKFKTWHIIFAQFQLILNKIRIRFVLFKYQTYKFIKHKVVIIGLFSINKFYKFNIFPKICWLYNKI